MPVGADAADVAPERGPGACPCCAGAGARRFHEVPSVPVYCNQLFDGEEAARRAPRATLALAFCPGCGFVWNAAFDPALVDYAASYEDSQAFSPRFLAFARELAEDLTTRHRLRGGRVLEIGCGKGDFLALLCETARARGIGIDPAFQPGRLPAASEARLEVIRERYDERFAHLEADLVVCRHTLEHLPRPLELLGALRRALAARPGTAVFFEVPDVLRVLREAAFWDLYYEHCSYFSAGSLARAFARAGFRVTSLRKGFADQYLLVEARVAGDEPGAEPAPDDRAELAAAVQRFEDTLGATVGRWRERIAAQAARGRPVALWGAGSKAVGFLTLLPEDAPVAAVVDINPNKQGRHLPVRGLRIAAPSELRALAPGLVIVMNPIYETEIRGDLHALGVAAEVASL